MLIRDFLGVVKNFLIVLLFVMVLSTVSVVAGNDGLAHDSPFGDSGAGVSFGGDAKYYDYLIPYNLTLADIGGYSIKCNYEPGCLYSDQSKYGTMSTSAAQAQNRVGRFNVEGTKGATWCGCTVKVDSNTGFQYVEKDGCKFYIAALPKAMFNYSAASGFYGFASLASTGVIYDMILLDGTVIHFATGDGIGEYHTNNDESDEDPKHQDKLWMTFCKLNLPQYKNLFHAASPNQTFEVFTNGSSDAISKFKAYYGISDSNPVVAVRMWNKSVSAGGLTVNPGYEGLSTKGSAIDGSYIPSDGSTLGVDGAGGVVNSQFAFGTYQELDSAVYSRLVEPNMESRYLNNAAIANLRQTDLEGLTDWKRNNEGNLKESGFIAILRWVVSLVGIVMTVWALLVYLAFWFDHINSFFYMDALHLLTFGQLHICPPGDTPTFKLGKKVKDRTVNHAQILAICMVAILFGSLLISGIFYTLVSKLVYLITSAFSRG